MGAWQFKKKARKETIARNRDLADREEDASVRDCLLEEAADLEALPPQPAPGRNVGGLSDETNECMGVFQSERDKVLGLIVILSTAGDEMTKGGTIAPPDETEEEEADEPGDGDPAEADAGANDALGQPIPGPGPVDNPQVGAVHRDLDNLDDAGVATIQGGIDELLPPNLEEDVGEEEEGIDEKDAEHDEVLVEEEDSDESGFDVAVIRTATSQRAHARTQLGRLVKDHQRRLDNKAEVENLRRRSARAPPAGSPRPNADKTTRAPRPTEGFEDDDVMVTAVKLNRQGIMHCFFDIWLSDDLCDDVKELWDQSSLLAIWEQFGVSYKSQGGDQLANIMIRLLAIPATEAQCERQIKRLRRISGGCCGRLSPGAELGRLLVATCPSLADLRLQAADSAAPAAHAGGAGP